MLLRTAPALSRVAQGLVDRQRRPEPELRVAPAAPDSLDRRCEFHRAADQGRLLRVEDQVPERARWIRTLYAELTRVLNHLLNVTTFGLDVGASENLACGRHEQDGREQLDPQPPTRQGSSQVPSEPEQPGLGGDPGQVDRRGHLHGVAGVEPQRRPRSREQVGPCQAQVTVAAWRPLLEVGHLHARGRVDAIGREHQAGQQQRPQRAVHRGDAGEDAEVAALRVEPVHELRPPDASAAVAAYRCPVLTTSFPTASAFSA